MNDRVNYKILFDRLCKNKILCPLSIIIALAVNLLYFRSAGVYAGGDAGFFLGSADSIVKNGGTFYLEMISAPYYWGYRFDIKKDALVCYR